MSNRLRPQPLDLFGEVPVTIDDLEAWLDHIPRMRDASDRRRTHYATQWHIADKVRAAKLAGLWPPETTKPPEHRRLPLESVSYW